VPLISSRDQSPRLTVADIENALRVTVSTKQEDDFAGLIFERMTDFPLLPPEQPSGKIRELA